MTIHPTVLQLSKRLGLFLPIPGFIAATTYVLSLSHSVYPGNSAALTAAAAGLIPPPEVSHPLFALAARNVAALDVFSLPVRLNLFSALCGTLCAMLLYRLVTQTILFSACEDAGGGGLNALTGDAEAKSEIPVMPPEVALYNRRMLPIAVVGGLIASCLLIFTAPVWTAATRLDTGLFDLSLALVCLNLFPIVETPGHVLRLTLSVFIFALGLFDTAVFLLLLPCYAFFAFKVFLYSRQRTAMGCQILAAGTAGTALSVYAYWQNTDAASAASLLGILTGFARTLPYQHYHELLSFFPRSGWLLVLVQTGLPALILLFGKDIMFKEKQASTLMAVVLVILAVTPGLLNLPISPFCIYQPINHLPVFGCALLVSATALAFAACLVFCGPDDRPATADDPGKEPTKSLRRLLFLRGFVGFLLSILLLLALLTPLRSFRVMDRQGASVADETARAILSVMKERTWLISNGYLDNHLLLQASISGKPLVLVTLHPQDPQRERERLKSLIAASPVFDGQNRQRLQNALTIGTVRFVMEWFTTDRHAGQRAMVLATPDIWTTCGYRAVPEGLAFGGVLPEETLDPAKIDEENKAFTDRIAPLLSKREPESGYIAALNEMLRMKSGLAANELGILLEELNQPEAAYQSYTRAARIDPMNISAVLNAYALADSRKIHSDALDRLSHKIKAMISDRRYTEQKLTGILQNYGSIRHKAFYQKEAALWSSLGSRAVAAEKSRKAHALSQKAGVDALVENALFYVNANDSSKAEACYLAALEQDASSHAALSGISMLMANNRNGPEAEKWIRKALEAGVEKDALLLQTVKLAMLQGNPVQALGLLDEATKKHPSDLRYWTLKADLLLSRGDTQIVENEVLPEMQKALKTLDNFLIHAVRGYLLKKKGPGKFKEARLSLLRALSLNAALPDIWNTVLELDTSLGNLAFTETDARSLLGIDPDHALANYLLGSITLARGSLSESEDFLRRSVEKSPTAAACNDLAENLRRQKKLAEAEVFVRQSLAADPNLLHALDTLACIQFDAGRFDESAQSATKAVASRPAFPGYQLTLLRAQVQLGDKAGVNQRLQALAGSKTAIPDSLRKEIDEMK